MILNEIKTISIEEVQKFLKEIKSGDVCNIVSRKYFFDSGGEIISYIKRHRIFSLAKEKFFKLQEEENNIVLILCTNIIYMKPEDRLSINSIRIPTPTPELKNKIWDKWCSLFLKVLYNDELCLIHPGWLEKIL